MYACVVHAAPPAVHAIKGCDGKCFNDLGDSSAKGAAEIFGTHAAPRTSDSPGTYASNGQSLAFTEWEARGRGREHFNDAVGWLTFRPGREVGARHSRHKQCVCRFQG